MGKRIRLGLIFSVDENWIGGAYYILNLISALATLPRKRQPAIIILSGNKTNFDIAKKTGYPFLQYHNPYDYKRNFAEAVINRFCRFILRKDVIDKRISSKKITTLFPAIDDPCFQNIPNKIYWFADFQHIFYPDFFKEIELSIRNNMIDEIAGGDQKLVLSSQAAKKDWESLSMAKYCTVFVIPFAVTHPFIEDIEIGQILKEFKIEGDYFIISNQFWIHKNHLVVLRAAWELSKQGSSMQFVFTGKEDDYRNPGYFQSILSFVETHHLTSTIKLLGMIDRRKQLKLMQNAKAVIQPSLFEGWSTVIEDAKSLGKIVIASDIPVHREQLNSGGMFFDPHNQNELVEKIRAVMTGEDHPLTFEYKNAVKAFGESFLKMIEN